MTRHDYDIYVPCGDVSRERENFRDTTRARGGGTGRETANNPANAIRLSERDGRRELARALTLHHKQYRTVDSRSLTVGARHRPTKIRRVIDTGKTVDRPRRRVGDKGVCVCVIGGRALG